MIHRSFVGIKLLSGKMERGRTKPVLHSESSANYETMHDFCRKATKKVLMVSKNADKSQQDRGGGGDFSVLASAVWHCKLHSSSIFGHFLCGFPLDVVILTD